jgi:hypothetical protein
VPIVIGINAGVADGRDPSWLWDVPFERLRGRLVVATGERGRDLAVRLRYADVRHTFERDYRKAVALAAGGVVVKQPEIDFVANYTSFQDARRALSSGRGATDTPVPEPAHVRDTARSPSSARSSPVDG